MMKHSTLSHITAAIAFDEHLEGVIETAAQMAVRSRARLRLVHVCDPWTKSILATSLQAGTFNLVQVIQSELGKTVAARLATLQNSLGDDLQISTAVLHAETVAGLCRDAEETGTDLIVLGASLQTYSNPRGMATAIGTVVDANVPVLVVNEACHPNFSKTAMRIAVADDLSDGGERSLSFARALLPSLGTVHVAHVHVQDGSQLRGALGDSLSGKSANDAQIATTLANWRREIEMTMMQRAEPLIAAVEELGGHYHTDIAVGHVAPEIERAANAHRADFIVFGKHKLFHKEQLTVGRVPFKTMLQQHRAVIVTP